MCGGHRQQMSNQLPSCAEQEGDHVIEFQQLCEVQSDKASVEITSQYEGTIMRLLHSKGDIVQVGSSFLPPLLLLHCFGADISTQSSRF